MFNVMSLISRQKNAGSRWQNNDGKSRESRAMTDMAEDEKDPDVIPANGKKVETFSRESLTVIPTSTHYGEKRDKYLIGSDDILFFQLASATDDDANNEWTDGTVNSYVRSSKFQTYFIWMTRFNVLV